MSWTAPDRFQSTASCNMHAISNVEVRNLAYGSLLRFGQDKGHSRKAFGKHEEIGRWNAAMSTPPLGLGH